jgi:hypothetical protein
MATALLPRWIVTFKWAEGDMVRMRPRGASASKAKNAALAVLCEQVGPARAYSASVVTVTRYRKRR